MAGPLLDSRLHLITCPTCARLFQITKAVWKQKRRTGSTLNCPNGHKLYFKTPEQEKPFPQRRKSWERSAVED